MDITLIIQITVAIIVLTYAIAIYNNLIFLKHAIDKSWANIDVLLKQRHDEIPKIVDTCKQYMKYEQETLEKVLKARNVVYRAKESHDIEKLGKAESFLRKSVHKLFAVSEDYPELIANEAFAHLFTRITDLEETIADRREFYNEAVTNYNVRITQFPDVLIAKLIRLKHQELLKFKFKDRSDINVAKLFKIKKDSAYAHKN